MKALFHLAVRVWVFAPVLFSAQAAFTSLYVFGDGVSTTTNNVNPSVAYLYYGHRFCNGRVWVEVVSQRQGLTYQPDRNWSYFGHYSNELVTSVNRFVAPPDIGTALVIVWVSDADFVYDLNHLDPPYATSSLPAWTNLISQSLTHHQQAIENLYAKGVRTLLMPNAVDLSKVPYYAYLGASDKSFVRQRVIDFNRAFAALIDQTPKAMPGLKVYVPDFFALLDEMSEHPMENGFVNSGVDALDDPGLLDKSLDGPGAHYLFWDYLDPTAKAHARMADLAQQLICPVYLANPHSSAGELWFQAKNVPVGSTGSLEKSTNLQDWRPGQSFDGTNVSQSLSVPTSDPREFFRVSFSSSWSWP